MYTRSQSILNLFLALVLFAAFLHAQETRSGQVDAFIAAEMQKQKTPGIAVAIVQDGKPVLVKGYGLANVEHQVRVKPQTIFQSGSVGKQFTSAAVMLLVEDGKISLDEKIGKYLGQVPDAWQNITVRHLLSHTGGMTDYPRNFDFRKDYTEDDLLKRAQEVPLAFQPGERWKYSNLGYVTLGILISKVTGKFYGDFLQERIFKPLGMSTARIISESDIVLNRAAGYRLIHGQIKNHEWVSPSLNTTGDGALYLSVLDMMKWDEALNTPGRLLKKESFDQMWSPIKLTNGKNYPYGFGWGFRELNGRRIIEHGGSWQGFKAYILRVPQSRLSIIVFANLDQTNPGKIANGIAEIFDPELKPKPITDTEPQVSTDVRQLFTSIVAGSADRTSFTREMQKVIFESGDRVTQSLKALGPMQKMTLVTRNEEEGVRLYRYKVEFSGTNFILAVRFNKDGKISLFGLQPE